jgi:hypothetical protein
MADCDVKLRPFRDSDKAFVLNSWKESYRWAPEVRWVPNVAYFNEMNRRVEDLSSRGKVLVACNPVDDDHIVGWCCSDGGLLHYVYVKTPMRGSGYALELIAKSGLNTKAIVCTHWTEHCEKFARKHGWIYTPSALTEKKGKAA